MRPMFGSSQFSDPSAYGVEFSFADGGAEGKESRSADWTYPCVVSMPGSSFSHDRSEGMMPDAPHSVPNPAGSSLGMQRQFQIYQSGLAGKKLSVPIPLAQLEKKAAEALSPQAYDYVAGSAS